MVFELNKKRFEQNAYYKQEQSIVESFSHILWHLFKRDIKIKECFN